MKIFKNKKEAERILELEAKLKTISSFATQLSIGDFSAELNEMDVEFQIYKDLRDNLIKAKKDDELRKIEDTQRNWTTEGLAKFADLMRQNHKNLHEFSYTMVSNLVKYINANQGGFFIYEENDKKPYLELYGSYAYDRRKYTDLKIQMGDGLVSACAYEKETIFLNNIPKDYIKITSGLGNANPTSLVLIPLKLEDKIYGVIEIASFNNIEKYQIDFLEKLAESISSTISNVKINMKTEVLLKQSQEQGEMLKQQEEEMRQNLEEMQATQEEVQRKNAEIESVMSAISTSLAYIEFNPSRKVINCNNEFTNLTGLPKDKVIGAEHKNFLSEDYISSGKYKLLWDKLLSGKHHTEVFYHKLPKGDFWSKESLTPVIDGNGNVVKVMMFVIDLTEQILLEQSVKQQTEELKASEEEMRQNLEEMNAIQEDLSNKSEEVKKEKERIELLLSKHKNETDELKSEIEMLNVQIKRKDKKLEELNNKNANF